MSRSLQRLTVAKAPNVASLPEPAAPPRVPAPRGVSLQEPTGGGGRARRVGRVGPSPDGRPTLPPGRGQLGPPCAPRTHCTHSSRAPSGVGSWPVESAREQRDRGPSVARELRQVLVAPGPRVLRPRRPGAAPAPPPSPPARGPPRAGPTAAGHGRATGGGGWLSAAEGPRGGLLSLRVPLPAARSSQPRTSWLATGTRPGGSSGVVLFCCPVELVALSPRDALRAPRSLYQRPCCAPSRRPHGTHGHRAQRAGATVSAAAAAATTVSAGGSAGGSAG